MAWVKHWQCCFKSFNGTQYAVNIYDQDYIGDVVQLIGAEEPFITQETDDSNIFTPIRKQTGYLRLFDDTGNGSLMEELMPLNNTQRLVRLYNGTWSDMYETFTEGTLKWQGFICAEAFTQPWNNDKKIVEFPVKNILAALEDVTIPMSNYASLKNIAWMIAYSFNPLKEWPNYIKVITNLNDAESDLLQVNINTNIFYEIAEQQNDVSTKKVIVPATYASVLEEIAKLYGLMFRTQDDTLYVSMYDSGAGRPRVLSYNFDDFENLTDDGGHVGATPTELDTADMLDNCDFVGSDNVAGFTQGAKQAIVNLSIMRYDSLLLDLPMTDEDASPGIEVQNMARGQVFVQPHQPRTNSNETYSFYEYQATGYQPTPSNPLYSLIGSSNYQNCLNNSVAYRSLYDPLYSTSDHLHTGAFPCRWYYKKDAQSYPEYKNGLFLNQMYLLQNVQSPYYCYSIRSNQNLTLVDGYIHITMELLNFIRGQIGTTQEKLYFSDLNTIWGVEPTTTLWCILSIGRYDWNGSQWVDRGSGNHESFTIDFLGKSIKSNKTAEMQVDETDGYFIPVSQTGMSGTVTFFITNVSRCRVYDDNNAVVTYYDNHSKILSELEIEFLQNIDPMASRRTMNSYRKKILNSGFSSDEEINLTIGTNNNNIPSPSFIRRNYTNTIDSLSYFYMNGVTRTDRPEKNLLARIYAQYVSVRRSYIGVISSEWLSGRSVADVIFSYIGKTFFGLTRLRNWRLDKQEVKFIEVS